MALLLAGSAWLLVHLCFWGLPRVFVAWNARTMDQLFVLRDRLARVRPPYDAIVVHVDLNDTTTQQLGDFYAGLKRGYYAQVVQNLTAMQVAAQVYDFIFADKRDERDDQALMQATAAANNVYFGMVMALRERGQPTPQRSPRADDVRYVEQTSWPVTVAGEAEAMYVGSAPLTTFPALARVTRGLGYLNSTADRDGVLRRAPLLVRYRDTFYPSLAFRVVCDYLHVPPERIMVKLGESITLRGAQRPGTATARDVVIPIDQHGNMVVNYLGPWERLRHYRFVDIVRASEDRDELELFTEELAGKIVVIAEVTTGLSSDIGATPLDETYPLSGMHSNIIHSIVTENFLRELAAGEMLLIEALLLGLLLALACRCGSWTFALGAVGLASAYGGFVTLGFLYGHFLANLVRPLLALTFAAVAIVVQRYATEEKARLEGLRQRDFIRDTFGRYLSQDVVEELLGSPTGLQMGGELRTITLLVSDLRGFTALAAHLSAPEVLAMLNRYFERMIDIVAYYHGTVDELQGDGMLTFFGAPLARPDDAERAVACAVAMQRALRDFNRAQQQQGLPELAMGIGLNTGEVIVGNIGSLKRSKYGAVGSAINTAYRIESYTVGGQIFLSPSTYQRVQALVQVRSTLQAQFKGLDQPVTLYEVGGIAGSYQLALPEKAPVPLAPLPVPLPLACFAVEGKLVGETAMSGQLTHLTGSAAEATLVGHLPAYTNVKLTLLPLEAAQVTDVYAKIMACDPHESQTTRIRLEFTALPDAAKALFTTLGQAPADV